MREEGGGGDVQRLIGDAAVAHHAICSAFQRSKHALHFALEPNVVLVGEKNVLAPCLSERMFEIVDGRSGLRPRNNVYNGIVEGAHHVQRRVGGAVVGNDDFVVGTQLREDGTQLLVKCGGTVVGGNADRDHEVKGEVRSYRLSETCEEVRIRDKMTCRNRDIAAKLITFVSVCKHGT